MFVIWQTRLAKTKRPIYLLSLSLPKGEGVSSCTPVIEHSLLMLTKAEFTITFWLPGMVIASFKNAKYSSFSTPMLL